MALTFNSVDPRTGEPGPSFEEATPDDVRAAVDAAAGRPPIRRAARPRQARRPPARRRRAAARGGRRDRRRLRGRDRPARGPPARRARAHLPASSRRSPRSSTPATTPRRSSTTPDPDAVPIPRPDVRRMLVPLGPVAVFGASNFPLAFSTAGGDTASALAAGCPVIVKGHPSHPGTGALVARELRAAVADAGLPDGTFANLPAAGVEVGEALVDAPEIAAVGFTGSLRRRQGDLRPRRRARAVPIPVYAEMGSINPIVVTEAALRRARGQDRRGARRLGRELRRPAVHQARRRLRPGRRGGRRVRRRPRRAARRGRRRTVLLNERLRDALRARVDRLAAGRTCGRSAARPRAGGPGFRHQPAAYEAPAGAARLGRAARGALRPGRAPAAPRLARGAAGRAGPASTASSAARCTPSAGEDVGGDRGRARRPRRPRRLRRLPDRRRGHLRHAPRRPVSRRPRARSHTSVGMTAVHRFTRPVAFQDAPRGRAPARAARGQPARDPPPCRRRAGVAGFEP